MAPARSMVPGGSDHHRKLKHFLWPVANMELYHKQIIGLPDVYVLLLFLVDFFWFEIKLPSKAFLGIFPATR